MQSSAIHPDSLHTRLTNCTHVFVFKYYLFCFVYAYLYLYVPNCDFVFAIVFVFVHQASSAIHQDSVPTYVHQLQESVLSSFTFVVV